jgi:thiamine kinase-like enzyme
VRARLERPILINWEYTRLGDPADEIAYLFDQNGLTAPGRQAFWRGYRASASSAVRLAHVARRVDWGECLTLLGSTLWWLERWVRRAAADAAGVADPAVPREDDYYFDQVITRLERWDDLQA